MSNIKGIYTIRDTAQPYYWDVVFEWEDEFAKALNVPLIPIGNQYDKIYKPTILKKLLNRLNYYQIRDKYLSKGKPYYLAFHIGIPGVYSFHSGKNVIPIVIDFWKNQDLKKLENLFSCSKAVVVTSLEVHNYLVEKGVKIKLHHSSLSLPDKYYQPLDYKSKNIDIIQIGRQNSILNSYMKRLLEEIPSIHYVYTEKKGGKAVNVSNRYGVLPDSSDRESFINMLRRTKISLLSAPGIDNDKQRTGGFSPVTPRFFESAACGCHMVGVYPDNDDFKYYGIDEICSNVKNYQEFKNSVLKILNSSTPPDYRAFLELNLSSVKAKELEQKLLNLT